MWKVFSVAVLVVFGSLLCRTTISEFVDRNSAWINKNHTNISCEKLLHEFQNSAKDFTTQIINNAVPVTYCNQSVGPYMIFEESYEALITHVDGKNISCKYKYFNVDRLGVIETMYNQLHSMWEVGFCDDCYANTTTATPSDTTVDFYVYWEHIHKCIEDNNKTGDPCLMCMGQYQKLNDFYDGIKSEKNDRICFDMQDAMNRTRILWSVKLNCCRDRNSSMLTAYIIGGVVSFLPGLFYVFVYCNKRYHERYDFLSDEQDTTVEEVENATRDNAPLIAQDQPGPSGVSPQAHQEITPEKKERHQISDDSDDEMLEVSRNPRKNLK